MRVGVAAVLGLLAGLLVPTPQGSVVEARWLVGFAVAALAFSVPFLVVAMRHDVDQTRAYVDGLGEARSLVDTFVIVAALTSLAAVATMLASGGDHQPPAAKLFDLAVSVGAVASAWLLVHTSYVLRYAKHYVNVEPGCIDFAGDAEPVMSDFAYLSFCLGMTYQVSDQQMTTPAVRRIVFWHTLLSYLFGTVVIASSINLVVGLAG